MKTTCLLLVTFFVGAVLAANGGSNKTTPSLDSIICDTAGCTGNIEFNFSGLDPSHTYTVEIFPSTGEEIFGITPSAAGTGSASTSGLPIGTWDLFLIEDHNNGNPAHNPVLSTSFIIG